MSKRVTRSKYEFLVYNGLPLGAIIYIAVVCNFSNLNLDFKIYACSYVIKFRHGAISNHNFKIRTTTTEETTIVTFATAMETVMAMATATVNATATATASAVEIATMMVISTVTAAETVKAMNTAMVVETIVQEGKR